MELELALQPAHLLGQHVFTLGVRPLFLNAARQPTTLERELTVQVLLRADRRFFGHK